MLQEQLFFAWLQDGSVKVRERWKRREQEETEPSPPSSCPSGGPGVCSSVLSPTAQPGTAALKQVLLITPPEGWPTINTHGGGQKTRGK